MRRRDLAALTVFFLCALGPAARLRAHDFWIEPSTFRPTPGQRVVVRLRVGQHFRGDPVPRDPALLQRFALIGPDGESPVPGVPGGEPAGFTIAGSAGLSLVTYASGRSPVDLDGAKFEVYLADEGLEAISALRAKRGQSAAPVREVFSRCAKAVLTVGGTGGAGYDRVLGLTLELVPELDPSGVPAGGELPVRLLYHGKPLAGALVTAISRDRPEAKVSGRTDRAGRVRLPLDHASEWLIKAVHMIPAAAGSGADWESFWASLTFQSLSR